MCNGPVWHQQRVSSRRKDHHTLSERGRGRSSLTSRPRLHPPAHFGIAIQNNGPLVAQRVLRREPDL